MRIARAGWCVWLLLACSGTVLAQAAKTEKPTMGHVEDHLLSMVEGEFVPAADAMPEDKYSFAPTQGEFKGVRTFAQQVKHVAAVNYMIGAAVLEEKPPVDIGSENGPDSVQSKAEIMKFLRDSFAYMHKAVGTINESNATDMIKMPWGKDKSSRLGLATIGLWHPFDHYGQMVEYLRMNGVVPPASR